MRKNSEFSAEELQALWSASPDDALLEWTYRVLETPSASDDYLNFVEWLLRKRFGDFDFSSETLKIVNSAPPIGSTTWQNISIRTAELATAPHQLQIYRLWYLLCEKQISIKSFLSGVRQAIRSIS